MNGTPWSLEEIDTLKTHCALSAKRLTQLLPGRTVNAIQQKSVRLGLDRIQYGERHYAAKLSAMQAQMIGTLMDAGYTSTEINETFDLDVSPQTIRNVGACRRYAGTMCHTGR